MTNTRVAENWRNGRAGNSKHLHTDGKSLYSYALEIGFTDLKSGEKIVKNYMSGGKFISMTTSQHVSIAKSFADKVVNP
jgi:hypothetical protein